MLYLCVVYVLTMFQPWSCNEAEVRQKSAEGERDRRDLLVRDGVVEGGWDV